MEVTSRTARLSVFCKEPLVRLYSFSAKERERFAGLVGSFLGIQGPGSAVNAECHAQRSSNAHASSPRHWQVGSTTLTSRPP